MTERVVEEIGAERLRYWLELNRKLHETELEAEQQRRLDRLQHWQRNRLASTYADFYQQARYRKAVRFFLDDLYAPGNLVRRNTDVLRVYPVMKRLLPDQTLLTVAHALELQALSTRLDQALALAMGPVLDQNISMDDYADGYQKLGCEVPRRRQIELSQVIGQDLDKLIKLPLIARTLRMCRYPARLAGLGQLQSFLERGFEAFRTMGTSGAFLEAIVERETELLNALLTRGQP